jgi:hypothetical protein
MSRAAEAVTLARGARTGEFPPMRRSSLRWTWLIACGLAGCATAGRRATILYTAVVAAVSPKEAQVEIDRRFLERVKDRVTIEAGFRVDDAARKPNPALLDGDLHVAGRAPELGFRIVAELMNAGSAPRAMARLERAESTHATLPVTAVWRLWPEHAVIPEDQRDTVPELTTPNPDHIFELHPLVRVAGISTLDTFHPVDGYRPGNARRTFAIYQDAECRLTVLASTVRFTTSNFLYNDVHFLLERGRGRIIAAPGGAFVWGAALDTDGNRLVDSLRFVLVQGSAPERAVRALRPGARLHVWGLPRVSFSELSRRIAAAGSNPDGLKGKLPYEIIVLGVYPD